MFERSNSFPASCAVLLSCAALLGCGSKQSAPPASPAAESPATESPAAEPPATEAPAGEPSASDAPSVERPQMTAEDCTAKGGTVVGDIGDGAIHRTDYACPSGAAPSGSIQSSGEGPVAVEGSVCCPG